MSRYVVLLNEEVEPNLKSKAERCLRAMLKDRAARPVLDAYGEPPIHWFATRETALAAGIDVAGRDITTPRPLPEGNVLFGMMSEKSGAIWLSADQPVDRLGHTLAHELGHLARAAYDADPVTQRAVKNWHKADTDEHEQSARAMERLLRKHQYA